MRQLAAIAVLMLAFGAAPPSYAVTEPLALADGEVLKTQVDRDERMTVPVRIGEQNTFTFIIDTGSQTTVLARSIAERLALPSSRRANIVGIGGRETADTVVVRELGLGRRSFQNMEVVLFEAHDIGADGIVGIDSLHRYRRRNLNRQHRAETNARSAPRCCPGDGVLAQRHRPDGDGRTGISPQADNR
jgi:predicted aspartyl protease